MKHALKVPVMAAIVVVLCSGVALGKAGQDANPKLTPQVAIAKMKATWDSINTYAGTVTVHEAKGNSIQDRVYLVRFEKPTQTRVDIVGGDGRGSVALWNGGDRVRGHQGGFLSFIKLNVDLHSKFSTDLRGSTIDQANFGALLAHLKSLNPKVEHVTTVHGKVVLEIETDPPAPNTDVTKEIYVLAPNWLPLEFYEYAGDKVVKHVVNSDLKLNGDIPASTWRL